MYLYTNKQDDYGKREMSLRLLLSSVKWDLDESESKYDMMRTLNLIYNGYYDGDYLLDIDKMDEPEVEFTGLDPIYATLEIERLYNRQAIIIGALFSQRISGYAYDEKFDQIAPITRNYLLNKKKRAYTLPFPINLDDQNLITSLLFD